MPPPATVTAIYRFGRFELNPSTRQLLVDKQPAPLGARAFDVLLVLIDRRDRLVTKNELLDLVWPGLVVEENNLQVQVSVLRKVLGQDAIATVAGRGYRFALEPTHTAPAPALSRLPKHNLPAQAASFIGRARELAELRQLLARNRLVTLVGVGGVGKTRLALQVAADVLDNFSGGVWLVDLARVTDSERVIFSVAGVLGVRDAGGTPLIETLAQNVAGRQALIVLDNCEHVLVQAAVVADRFVKAAPDVRVLATSRERLRVDGEQVYALGSLGLPSADVVHDPATIESSESVALFVDRARRVKTDFDLSGENALVVAEICRRLDGIPLAIELAAARVSVLSVKDIQDKLKDRLRLLTGGGRGGPARHQTLRAAIDWSYDHLNQDEQRLFRALSVFAGGWTLASAQFVSEEYSGDFDTLEILSHLVDKSLVLREPSRDSKARYSMLETLRQYAQELLVELGEVDATKSRHLDFYVALAEEAASKLETIEQGEWLARLDADRENLLEANEWTDSAVGGAERGLRIASAIPGFWVAVGFMQLAHRIAIRALTRPGAAKRSALRGRTLFVAGQLGRLLGHYTEAKTNLEEGLSISQEIGDTNTAAHILRNLGVLCNNQGDGASAQRYLEDSLALAREMGSNALVALAYTGLGEMHCAARNLESAQSNFEEALLLHRKQENSSGVALVSLGLARVLILRGKPDRARTLLLDAINVSSATNSNWEARAALDVLAGLGALTGDWLFAARMRGAADAQFNQLGYRRERPEELFLAPLTIQMRQVLGDDAYRDAFDTGYAMPFNIAVTMAHSWLVSDK
jgi:predicted ATPase/DNA-binding winged helix-turn-helix (wHTH) protein